MNNIINHDPTNLYYDILVSNIQSNNSPPVIVNYLDTRSIPLLKDTTDYALSIITLKAYEESFYDYHYYTAKSLVMYIITYFGSEFDEIIIKGKNRLEKEYKQELKYKQYFSKYVLPYVLNDQQSMYKDFYSTYVINQMKYVHKYGIYLIAHSDTEE